MQKNARFCTFWCPSAKKIQMPADRTILTPACLPIAHLKPYGPYFSWKISKVALFLKFWAPARSKVNWSRFVSLKKPVFQAFFWRKSSFSAISTKGRPPLHIHRWKAMDLSFLTMWTKALTFEPAARQNFVNALGMVWLQDLTLRHNMMNLVDEDTLDQDHLTIIRCSITPRGKVTNHHDGCTL